jgi:Flp pilus assembly protein TadG
MALIVFGSIEAANGIYLKQVATQAAYEAARVVTTPGGTQQDAWAVAHEVLDARKIRDASVTFSPQVTSSTPAGTAVSVRVEAPLDQNALAPAWFFRGAEFSATVRMSRN